MADDAPARVQLALELEGDPAPLTERHVRTLVTLTLHAVQAPPGVVDLGVQFVSAEEIAAMNGQLRGVDEPTDVLSFPLDGLDELPAGVPRQLGDVTVCTAYVERQLADGTTMVPREGEDPDAPGDATLEDALARCVVHGTLHLLGYDHERGEHDAREMFEIEERALGGARALR